MSSSKSKVKPKFLLDENVRRELYDWLKHREIDVRRAPKGAANGELAQHSLREGRVLVTNDEDFTKYAIGEVFGIVWLRVPQDDPEGLLNAFASLLTSSGPQMKDALVMLWRARYETFALWEDVRPA